jgi:hypothetical protein
MHPITRSQLQNAPADYVLEKERAAICQQELAGQVWAEGVYKRVRDFAREGNRVLEVECPSNISRIGFSYAICLMKQWFPDSDITTVLYGALKDSTRYGVRIDWSDKPAEFDREQRRFEKETNW